MLGEMTKANSMNAPSDLQGNQVYVWHADLRLPKSELARLHDLLNEEEQERALRFKVPMAREQFVISHGFLRLIIARYLGTAPTNVQIAVGEHGKPMLAGNSKVKFNLSHTDGAATIAVTRNHEVGVDVERVRKDINVLELSDRFFSAAEAEWIRGQSENEQAHAFYLCWTAKEAYVKACGTGLSMPLSRFSLIPSKNQQKLTLQSPDALGERDRWSIWQIHLQPELCCAVAVHAPEAAIHVKKWDWNRWLDGQGN